MNYKSLRISFTFSLALCACAALLFLASCSTKPIDPRTVIPGDALIYVESDDLGKTVAAITDSEAFARFSKKKPDLSAINGVKISIAVTGFERDEQELTEEHGVIKFQPHFVAVAETNAWSWQAERFSENKLGEFINEIFGGETELEVKNQPDGKRYTWKSQDGRKVFGLLQGSLLYFANDESSIEKCLAVKRGEAESIANNPKLTAGSRLAFGYVSTDGVAQLANIAGLSIGVAASEESEVRNFVESVLPQVVRGSVSDITWTSTQTEKGISDRFDVALVPDVARVANETLKAGVAQGSTFDRFIPGDLVSVTQYSVRDPRVAWRSVVLTAQSKIDTVNGNLLAGFSDSIFEPYAIENAEQFLGAVNGKIVTIKLDPDGEDAAAVAEVRDAVEVKKGITKEIDFSKSPEKIGEAEVWKSADGQSAAAFAGSVVVVGDTDTVLKCINASMSPAPPLAPPSDAIAFTIANEVDPTARLIEVLGERHDETTPLTERSYTSTSFDAQGMHRTTVSDFGTIGAIIEQFVRE
jgi:hypothetical protein